MKRIITLLLTLFVLVAYPSFIQASNNHLFVDDTIRNTFESGDEEFIEQELKNIDDKYDIGIYFVYDSSLANDQVSSTCDQYLNSYNGSTNTVVLCLNNEYYSIKALGPNSDIILNNKSTIFNAYHDTSTKQNYYEGIIDYYQLVVKLINGETYEPNVPVTSNRELVYDGAGLLNEEEKQNLVNNLEEISEKYGMDFVVVTTNSTEGKDIQDYADDFYDYNGYAGNGILFLIDMGSKSITISTSGRCIEIVDDETIDYIFDDMMDDLKAGKYYDAFKTFYKDADYYVNHNNNQDDIEPAQENKKGIKKINFLLSGGISAVVTLIAFIVLRSQLKSVKRNKYAANYINDKSFVLTGFSDLFINKTVSRTPIPKDDDRSSGGGSSHTSHFSHTSSSGISHGGHSRGF